MATHLTWPDWLDELWAKSPHPDKGGEAESLVQHTWNVLEKLAISIRLRWTLPEALGLPRLWHCLFWACWLHDWGKVAEGFQVMLRGGMRWHHRHEVLSLAFLDWIREGFTSEELNWVAAAIASHHRDHKEIRLSYSSIWLSEEDNSLQACVALISESTTAGLWRWLKEAPSSWIKSLGLADAGIGVPIIPDKNDALNWIFEKGAKRAAYWLRSYSGFVERINKSEEKSLIVGTMALRGYLINADYAASAHVSELSAQKILEPAELLGGMNLDPARLYPHQRRCMDVQGSAVLVAPTGSGKTEAALFWACNQRKRGDRLPRLYYMLPYQASMNAMYDILNGGPFHGDVGLEHSRSVLALYRRLLEECLPPEAGRVAKWVKTLAKLNCYPVRILSPYQILKAPYRIKGFELLLSDCFHAGVVVDEVHAYEPARLAMILSTFKYLKKYFDVRFFMMSATFPRILMEQLADILGEYTLINATPELYARFRRHRLHLAEGDLMDDHWMQKIAGSVLKDHAILVCCNTVKRAQQAYIELRNRLPEKVEVVLLHGRFNGRDRLLKEKTVQESTGCRSEQRRQIALVATQVIEVSLDIDLNVIYTDPAPLEALVQRFGRINRRRLKDSAPVYVFTEPHGGQGVYDDNLIKAAIEILNKNAGKMIEEEAISDWLDQAYRGNIGLSWIGKYRTAYQEFWEGPLSSLRAFNSDKSLEEAFYRAFDSLDVLPSGLRDDYLSWRNADPLGASQLLVPLRWGQFVRLMNQGRAVMSEEGGTFEVDAPYDSKFGLNLAS